MIVHATMRELAVWLDPGDLLVVNNSRVLPARIRAEKEGTGGRVELLLLRHDDGIWRALAKPVRRLRPGTRLRVKPRAGVGGTDAAAEVLQIGHDGEVSVRFADDLDARLGDYGEVPLPPYIHRQLEDPERYQTVYASVPGSAAAPTAGLHLTPELTKELAAQGVGWAEVTLHIGLDTFRPVTAARVAEHRIHREWCSVSDESAGAIARTRQRGNRVVAVGTTSARTLETLGRRWADGSWDGFAGPTDLFITPGYRWRLVDALLTNFHLPRSTLLMMVSALAGRKRILAAYHEAIEMRYRFFSFGDAMLIL